MRVEIDISKNMNVIRFSYNEMSNRAVRLVNGIQTPQDNLAKALVIDSK